MQHGRAPGVSDGRSIRARGLGTIGEAQQRDPVWFGPPLAAIGQPADAPSGKVAIRCRTLRCGGTRYGVAGVGSAPDSGSRT
jgi:hypothetical protein